MVDMKAYDRMSVDQWALASMGGVLMALSVAGMVHASCAALAAQMSCRAQFRKPQADVNEVLWLCQRAYSLYPWNYYFSAFSAEMAYLMAAEANGEARDERMRQARLWCDRGLVQNKYVGQLRRLKTHFLWEESPSMAIRYWEAHANWQYWEPYNHETLAGLYAKFGEFDKAVGELKLIENFPSYEPTRRMIELEKKAWAELRDDK